ncbi:SAM-dependent methyltransferase [Actinopolymorpha pittospori]|uniref:SAM-dependent methyltransferase n=1 Tax=Actinopolymorpha pittospori TaxID=648752 RepID=A0A927RC12_9ACTN|nr:class I SAM-dependent methyltransferase [Actinopolymorpha pittospori]MBE1606645.1 SAM-dependent methyltransferase [Actinopolymorpha pittospori]
MSDQPDQTTTTATTATTADVFDAVFSAYERSPRVRELFRADFDPSLPPEVELFSFTPSDALRLIALALDVAAGDTLVDLACGRGGPGMWVARETGARLVGVDVSPVAVAQAQRRAADFGLSGRAEFRVGAFAETAEILRPAMADGVMCVDALHFAPDPLAAARDVARILRPGRTFALTTWEGPRNDAGYPAELAGTLVAAGFVDVNVEEHPEWDERRRALYVAALELEPGDDTALANLQREASVALPQMAEQRRLLITARSGSRTGRNSAR